MSQKERYSRTQQEILRELRTQEMFLQSNMNAIAENKRDFHKQLAGNFRVLFHDMRHGQSIFSQLKWKNKIKMVTSCGVYSPTNILPFIGLAQLRVESEIAQYGPKGIPETFIIIPFEKWWNEEIVINDGNKKLWTRKDLVINVADQDGGAHLDPTLPMNYYKLAYENSLGIKFFNGITKEKNDLENPIPSCLWQIGLEYIMSIEIFTKGKFDSPFDNR